MRTDFAGIIFDLDGTLVDSESVWLMAETRVIEGRGHIYTAEARALVLGLRIDAGMGRVRDYYGISDPLPVLVEEVNRFMVELVPQHVRAKPGAQALIDRVIARGLPHAIASASSRAVIDAIVAHMGWLDTFPIRCTADDEAHGKPAPDVYLTAARRAGVRPSDCLAIEDTPSGARAAIAAGMTCFVVPDHAHAGPELFADITPHLFDSLHDILSLLERDGML
jgi:HAD superfamily hydrolase (TIGR01509 family)